MSTMTSWIKKIRKLLLAIGCCYLGIMIMMTFLEKSLIFFPSRKGNWTPTHADVEDAWFTAADGVKIHGWYFDHPNPQAVILFAHGNAGNLIGRAGTMDKIRHLADASVLIFDYRGYGQSDGKPDEPGILADARAARAWLSERAGVPESEITLMGRSLGSGVVVDLAARDGARGLILESAFTSLPDTAAEHYSWLPVRWLMRTRLDSAAKIASYDGPLLMSHGDADRVVPYKLGQRLFELAPSAQKEFVTIRGGDHNDPQPGEYYTALATFVATNSLRSPID
ncbi:MAG: alpha/beta hydrolase [Pirellulales bacterium]|nr:alpha/beta hydrolase [Pirellulales bacterium]